MIPAMDKAASERILDAVYAVVDQVDAGESPNDAIEKVARDRDLPPGHIPLLVNAYNIGRTAKQRRDGGDVVEKSADFAMADASVITNALFPPVKEKAAKRREFAGIDSGYAGSPRAYLAVKQAAAKVRLMAPVVAARQRAVEKQASVVVEEKPLEVNLLATLYQIDHKVASLRYEDDVARRDIDRAIEKLATVLLDPRRPSYDAVIDVVRETRGDSGVTMLKAAAALDDSVELRKLAHAHHRALSSDSPYREIDEALLACRKYTETNAKFVEVEKIASAAHASIEPTRRGPRSILDPIPAKTAGWHDAFRNAAMYNIVASGLDNFEEQEPDQAINREVRRIGSPEHDAELDRIRRQALVSEMFDDDVIGGHDPRKVLQHYNQFGQYAPHASSHSTIAIPVVRKALEQGHPEVFDSAAITDIDQKLRPAPANSPNKPAPKSIMPKNKDGD